MNRHRRDTRIGAAWVGLAAFALYALAAVVATWLGFDVSAWPGFGPP